MSAAAAIPTGLWNPIGPRGTPSSAHRGRQVQVAIVGGAVAISAGGEILRVHAIKHDRSSEHGASANASGRPSRINAVQPAPGL